MIRRPPRSTPLYSSAASDVYKRQPPPRPHMAMAPPFLARACGCGDPSLQKRCPSGRRSGRRCHATDHLFSFLALTRSAANAASRASVAARSAQSHRIIQSLDAVAMWVRRAASHRFACAWRRSTSKVEAAAPTRKVTSISCTSWLARKLICSGSVAYFRAR